MTSGEPVNKGGRPRELPIGSETIAFRIAPEDMAELLQAIDDESLTLSQLARMIVHGWAEDRRRRSGSARARVPARARRAAAR